MSNISKQLSFIFIILLSITIFSCDEVPVTIPDSGNTGGGPITGDTTVRAVLLQDFTGVRCPNCPSASAEAERLLEEYGDQLAVIGVHGFFQCIPLEESKYDFRNPAAQTLEFGTTLLGKPAGAINRRQFDNQEELAIDSDFWESKIQEELAIPADVKIELSVSEANGTITVNADVTPIIDLVGGYNIAIAITQSDIEDPQEDNTGILEDYVHEHVLRHMFTSPFGDILGMDLEADVKLSRTYTFEIPANDQLPYDIDHLEIVAYVTRDGASESPVIQVVKAKF